MAFSIQDTVDLGLRSQRAGDFDQASRLFSEAIHADPSYANAWHLWGTVAFQQRKYDSAIERMLRAVELKPSDPDICSNLGLALTMVGRLDEAEAKFQDSLRLRSENADAHFKLGNVQRAKREIAAAEQSFLRAIELKPDCAEAYCNLGALYVSRGDLPSAIELLRRGIQAAPDAMEIYGNLAIAYDQHRQFDEAIAVLHTAISRRPRDSQYQLSLANIYSHQDRHEEALLICNSVIADEPDNSDAWHEVAAIFLSLRRLDNADLAAAESLRLRPNNIDALIRSTLIKLDKGNVDAAIEFGRRAIATDPYSWAAYDSLGCAYSRKERYREAIECFEKAIEIDPNCALAHFHLGLTLLAMGRHQEAWPEYEWRLQHPDLVYRKPESPRWRGEPLEGRTILVQSEQGFGDLLQFARYAKVLRERGAHVILECFPSLIPFLSSCDLFDSFVTTQAPLPATDFHCPLMSLGTVIELTPENPPVAAPYLRADVNLAAHWRQVIRQIPGRKVGIAWQGDTKHTWDQHRSTALDHFARLAKIADVTLVSLQRGTGEQQLASAQFPVIVFNPPLDSRGASFCDTAAVMRELDLVITVDTAVAHVAGGLGVPTWLLLNAVPDWRWGTSGETTAWYPSMRLFRQQKLGDWDTVFQQVANALAELTTNGKPLSTAAELLLAR